MKKVLLLLCLMISSTSIVFAENITLYQAGKKAFTVGLYSIALENFEQYLDSDDITKGSDTLYMSALSLYYLKQYSDSLTYLEGLVEEYPNSGYTNRSHYWFALNYYYLERYNEAVVEFKSSAEDIKYRDVSNLYIALSSIKLEKIDDAIGAFKTVINSNEVKPPFLEEAIYRLATLYLEEGSLNLAAIELNRLILDLPSSKYYNDGLRMLADTYYLLKEWEDAERTYELLMDLKPDPEYLFKRLSVVKWKLGRDEEALNYLTQYDLNYGDDLDVLNMLGDLYFKRGEYNRAASVYKRVLSVPKVDVKEGYYRLATAYFKLGDYSAAYNYFTKGDELEDLYYAVLSGLEVDIDVKELVLTLNTRYPNEKLAIDAINRLINLYDDRSREAELEEFLVNITDLYKDNIEYALTLGEIYLESGEFEKSLKYLGRGYTEESEFYENLSYKIGWIYYHRDELVRAISYFDRVGEESEDYYKALYSKAIAYYRLGDVVRGQKLFTTLLNYDTPHREEVAYYLGQIAKDKYNYEAALEYFQIALEKDELYIESLTNMGWSYYQLERYEDAIVIYRELENSFNIANCYLNLKNYDSALEYYFYHISQGGEYKESSYYRVVEILYLLKRDSEAWDNIKDFHREFPESRHPQDLIINEADNRMFGGDVEAGMILYNQILDYFKTYPVWNRARFRKAEALYRKELYRDALTLYTEIILSKDSYTTESINKTVEMLNELLDPSFTLYVIEMVDHFSGDREILVPLYITYIEQFIGEDSTIDIIERELSITKKQSESHRLIYLTALYYYNRGEYSEAESNLLPLMSRAEVGDSLKIDATTLQGELLAGRGEYNKVIDLYLKLYLEFSEYKEPISLVLFRALEYSREINSPLEEKIIGILRNEYSDTYWGSRLNEE